MTEERYKEIDGMSDEEHNTLSENEALEFYEMFERKHQEKELREAYAILNNVGSLCRLIGLQETFDGLVEHIKEDALFAKVIYRTIQCAKAWGRGDMFKFEKMLKK